MGATARAYRGMAEALEYDNLGLLNRNENANEMENVGFLQ
jgi:hypothetical protein